MERGICLAGTIAEATARDVTVRLATPVEVESILGRDALLDVMSGASTATAMLGAGVFIKHGAAFVPIGVIHEIVDRYDRVDVTTFGDSCQKFIQGARRRKIEVEGYVGGAP